MSSIRRISILNHVWKDPNPTFMYMYTYGVDLEDSGIQPPLSPDWITVCLESKKVVPREKYIHPTTKQGIVLVVGVVAAVVLGVVVVVEF